ncbi:hypothetical protein JF66_22115 [Cryobacterium sp. MLB-32]|uniref:hypothetical protein n=1 Tax=Cryobacterium sp. MLB-32 TaxID=1529318 RepID=UPI0004E77DF5|nr:hypothetical protein [Cryobacterium sp. MLB-32]KFF57972.1 hypothetical protein JF66_22115 [Cryobacterium sp. MLB-32]
MTIIPIREVTIGLCMDQISGTGAVPRLPNSRSSLTPAKNELVRLFEDQVVLSTVSSMITRMALAWVFQGRFTVNDAVIDE